MFLNREKKREREREREISKCYCIWTQSAADAFCIKAAIKGEREKTKKRLGGCVSRLHSTIESRAKLKEESAADAQASPARSLKWKALACLLATCTRERTDHAWHFYDGALTQRSAAPLSLCRLIFAKGHETAGDREREHPDPSRGNWVKEQQKSRERRSPCGHASRSTTTTKRGSRCFPSERQRKRRPLLDPGIVHRESRKSSEKSGFVQPVCST